ncbi:MAG: restriction endonuclease subunit S [Planctomycetia bacterium]|nr:restriction endonuclease subunit S [Planctomycetia bacterium]
MLHSGDLVISRAGSVGTSHLLSNPPSDIIFASYLIRFRTIIPSLASYLAYFLKSAAYWEQIAQKSSGIALPNINARKLEMISIPIAPLAEQRRIVAKIEELFSELDAGVAALERVKANLKRYRAAVLKAAVEGKLTAEWRKKYPPTEFGEQLLKRILAERQKKWEEDQLKKFAERGKTPPKDWRLKYQPPQPPEATGMPMLPEGWCWATIRQVADVGTGGTPSRSDPRFFKGGTIPWLTSTVVNEPFVTSASEFVTPDAVAASRLRLYPSGTLLVALYGEGRTRGKVTEITFAATVNQAIGALVFPEGPRGLKAYLKLFLTSAYSRMRGSSAGGVQPNLNLGLLSSFCAPIPSFPEQHQIVAEVERRLSVADAVAVEVEHSLKRAASLRQAILKRAFAGKLVAQDPADEPASVLLERIKAERAATMNRPAKAQTPKIRPTANIARPAKNARKLSRKIWLARATIAAYGVNALADQPTFGRVQLQKFLYLAQEHIGLDLQFKFEKQAAGPFDKDIYKIESNAKQQEWFYPTGNRGDATHYHPGPKMQDRLAWAGRMFKKQLPEIDKLIKHLRGMNTHQAELFATIHAVWSELLAAGKTCGVDEIVKGVHAWHESKKRFTSAQIEEHMQWMRERGYVPEGKA